jgi:hypothetical protein
VVAPQILKKKIVDPFFFKKLLRLGVVKHVVISCEMYRSTEKSQGDVLRLTTRMPSAWYGVQISLGGDTRRVRKVKIQRS